MVGLAALARGLSAWDIPAFARGSKDLQAEGVRVKKNDLDNGAGEGQNSQRCTNTADDLQGN